MAPEEDESRPPTRRRVLGSLAALAGLLGAGAVAWGRLGPGGPSVPTPTPTATGTPVDPGPWQAAVERYAPDLFFGHRERWFPTDPRPYATDTGDRRVVDGPSALATYASEFRAAGRPPRPTVCYHVGPVGDAAVALQYWCYSVFDQFSVNFHWHDWELLQVFLDRETREPLLLSASAHARSCPNNEYLAPAFGPDDRPAVLAEVGSHSSATDVNAVRPTFQRLGTPPGGADVSNAFVRPVDWLVDQPFAYGLPRDEGLGVPYALPELEGVPLHEHSDVPGVGLEDFVDADVTVRDWHGLPRPPASLPPREAGTVLTPPGSATAGDGTYALVPLADVADAVDDFVGPQLSFEFAVPGFVEDRVAHHLTSAGIPWEDPRATDPASDITDPAHRRAVVGAAPPGLADRVVGAVAGLVDGAAGMLDGVDSDDHDALAPLVSVSLLPLPVEVVCRLASDPVATGTQGGVLRFVDVERGEHELVVNGPGLAPYAERFVHGGGTVRPGVDGRVTLVANEDAVVLRADRRDSTGVARVRIVERFAGVVYDARPVEDGRFAVAVHGAGRYTVEVTDDEGRLGVLEVDPAGLEGEALPTITTGKVALVESLVTHLGASADRARQTGTSRTVPLAFEEAAEEARGALDLARRGDAAGANDALVAVLDRLEEVRAALDGAADDYGETDLAFLRQRARRAEERTVAAVNTTLAG